jgi:hypothetical protein
MSGRGLLLSVVGSLMLAIGVGSALGAIPDPGDGRYHACRVEKIGALHMINYPKCGSRSNPATCFGAIRPVVSGFPVTHQVRPSQR